MALFLKRFYSFQFAIPAIVGAMFMASVVIIGTGIFFEGHIKKLFDAKVVLLQKITTLEKIRSGLLIGLVTPEEIKDWMGLVDGLDRKGSVLLDDIGKMEGFIHDKDVFLEKLRVYVDRLGAGEGLDREDVVEFVTSEFPGFLDSLEKAVQAIDRRLDESRRLHELFWIVMCILGGIFVCFVGFFNMRFVLRPLGLVVGALEDGSKGVYKTVLAQYGPKEVQTLMSIYNVFASMMTNMFSTLRSQEGMIDHVRDALSSLVDNVEVFSRKLDEVAGELRSTSSDASTSMEAVAKAMQDLFIAASEIARNVQQATQSANEAMELSIRASEAIARLDKSSETIGDVVKVISTIAEQTNLLALNATIEAARAGEAGKGFAVVANEVKELAKQTAQATEEITQMITTIQEDTRGAVESVNRITRSVETVTDLANTIASATEEQTATISEITDNVEAVHTMVGGLESRAGALKTEIERLFDMNTDLTVCKKGMEMIKEEFAILNAQVMVEPGLDKKLMAFIPEAEKVNAVFFQHLQWREKLMDAIIANLPPEVEIDPTRCGLGTFLKEYVPTDPAIKQILNRLMPVHEKMHREVVAIQDMTVRGVTRQEILEYFKENIEPCFEAVISLLNDWSGRLKGHSAISGSVASQQHGFKTIKRDSMDGVPAGGVGKGEFIKWGPNFSVNIRQIDEQHKKLVNMVNELYNAYQQGQDRTVAARLLDELINYTVYHFGTEEKMLKEYGYPEADAHKKIHENLTKKVLAFKDKFDSGKANVSKELLNFLKDWLSNHICVTDKRYGKFFNDKGVR